MARTYRRDPYNLKKGKTFRDGHKTMASTPSWWVREFMNKPKRRRNKMLCCSVVKGASSENIAWPLGNHKPHIYYW